MTDLVAFIPARGGSKRIPGKNTRPFFGHPLLAYAIQGAIDSGAFSAILVSSDDIETLAIAAHYGALPIPRPPAAASDTSPDAEWIAHALAYCPWVQGYAILRPTSPFRTGATIRRAVEAWDGFSHLKAVEPVHQHPAKMWRVDGQYMRPLWDGGGHLHQTNTLERIHVQNAALELRVRGVMDSYQPFLTSGYEGFDLNTPNDWLLAETLVQRGMATPPRIERRPYGLGA